MFSFSQSTSLERGKPHKITTEFDDCAMNLLANDLELPEYALLLLDLYGMRTLKDLTTLGTDEIDEIIKMVREDSFERVDLKSRVIRIRYLGHDFADLKTFNFKPMDLRKLKSKRRSSSGN